MPGQGEQKQRPNYNRPVSQSQVIWTDAGVCVCDTSWHPDLKLSFDVVWSSLISQKTFIWDLPIVMANASQGANFLGVKDAQGVQQIFRVYSSSCIRPDPRKFTPQPQL